MDETRLDNLLDIALATGELPADATDEERAELAPLLQTVTALEQPAAQVASEAAETMPVAGARFQRFIASEASPAPPEQAAQHPSPGWLVRLFGSRRPLAAAGVAAGVVVLAVVGVLGSDLLFSDASSAYALEADPGDFVQIDGVVIGVTDGDDGPRIRLESEAGYIDIDLSDETSIVDDSEKIDPSAVRVGQRLAVAGLVNDHRRLGATTMSVQAADAPRPGPIEVDHDDVSDKGIQGNIVAVRINKDRGVAKVTVRRSDGKVATVDVDVDMAVSFIGSHGFGPGVDVELTRGEDGHGASVKPLHQLDRDDPCERSRGILDSLDRETICGVLEASRWPELKLLTLDGVLKVRLLPEVQILIVGENGFTPFEWLEADVPIGHGLRITGTRRGEDFLASVVIIEPWIDLPPSPAGPR